MSSALNLTLKIKQSPENLATLKHIEETFAEKIQKPLDEALRESKLVHFARILNIDNLYLQVITEYDGDENVYTEFFRQKLFPIFALVFSLGENPPDLATLQDPAGFAKFSKSLNVKSFGTDGLAHEGEEKDKGYFFQAYPDTLVPEILEASK